MRLPRLDGFERALGFFDALVRRSAVINQRQLDVVERGGARQQIESLKDEADLFVADGGEIVIVELADQPARQPVFPARRSIEATDQIHKRGFSRAGWSHDGDIFAAADLEIDAAQGVYQLRTHGVILGQSLCLDGQTLIDEVLAERLGRGGLDGH